MSTKKYRPDPALAFAALKLLEQLQKDGKIPAYMFRNILMDYVDVVDLAKFTVTEEQEDQEEAAA